jgi:hypothetical protein
MGQAHTSKEKGLVRKMTGMTGMTGFLFLSFPTPHKEKEERKKQREKKENPGRLIYRRRKPKDPLARCEHL